jgi:GNAT superfamily N-acetyltransferase
VAAAKWIFYPTANPDRWTEAIDPLWILPEDQEKGNSGLGVEDKEYVTWVLSQTNKRRREDVTGPGALLDLCFTAPQYQGKGAGRLLVEWGTKRADEMGVPVGDGRRWVISWRGGCGAAAGKGLAKGSFSATWDE